MARSDNDAPWQQRVLDAFAELRGHPDFSEDMNDLAKFARAGKEADVKERVRLLCIKYNAPKGFEDVLFETVFFDSPIMLDKARPPVMLVTEPNLRGLPAEDSFHAVGNYLDFVDKKSARAYLELSPDAQQKDILKFVKDNAQLIKDTLKEIQPHRVATVKPKLYRDRDYEIMRLYKEKRAAGLTRGIYREIMNETGYSDEAIRDAIKEYRAGRKRGGQKP